VPNLLTNLVDYSRQEAMDGELEHIVQNKEHCVIGCGGIGYWVAIYLAMLGTKHLMLVDGDRVESTNLNRIPAPPRLTGKFKVNALKAQIRLLRPGLRITNIPANITEDTLSLMGSMPLNRGVIWDCTDDARVQLKIFNWCRLNTKQYVKLGYEGWQIGMYRNMSMWIPDDYRPGYTTSKANVLSSSVIASLGIMYYCRGNMDDINVDLMKLVEGGYIER